MLHVDVCLCMSVTLFCTGTAAAVAAVLLQLLQLLLLSYQSLRDVMIELWGNSE